MFEEQEGHWDGQSLQSFKQKSGFEIREDQDGEVGGCGNNLPPTNTSKIHLHVEQSSLKSKQRLEEIFLYNQSCEKDPHRIR